MPALHIGHDNPPEANTIANSQFGLKHKRETKTTPPTNLFLTFKVKKFQHSNNVLNYSIQLQV